MHDVDAAGKSAVRTEADPLPVGRPSRNGSWRIKNAPRFAPSIYRCNVKMRNLVFRARKNHRTAVRRDIAIRVACRAWRNCKLRRTSLRGPPPDTQRFHSPGIEIDGGAVGRKARINLRHFSRSDLARKAAARRHDPQVPRTIRLVAR